MQFFDTHCHLDDVQFDDIRVDVVARAQQAGVATIVAVGTTAESSRTCVDLATRFDGVVAAVGIQPNYCHEVQPGDWDVVRGLAERANVNALGETGLDRYWDHAPFDLQQDYFDRHLRLAQQLDLPFIVHMRDCEAEVVAMLRDARSRGPLRGVMHSFTGTESTARECLELGLHVSFAGMVTYPKSNGLRDVAATIPDDRLLIETDAPYLSPHPKRARRPNEPELIVHTARCLAEQRGVPLATLADRTTRNAQRLFLRGDFASRGAT